MKKKRIAVVTGASSGMGREFALALEAKRGELDEMWVIARRADRLEALRGEISIPLRVLAMDLTDPHSFDAYAALLKEEKPGVRYLINCSGFGKFGRYDQIPLSDSLSMIDLNCKALVSMTELTLPYMHRGAHIIELDSLSSFQPVPYLNVYAATKAFVLSYSRSLNCELKDRGIHVMAVCPGWVQTEFFDRATTTSQDAVTYFNILYQPRDIIRTAMKDMERGKDLSIHGLPVKAQVLAVKLLPHSLVMKIWLRQQKH